MAAERGHKVILCEKSARLGGNLIPGGVPEFKRYDHQLVRWYERHGFGITGTRKFAHLPFVVCFMERRV